MPYRLNLIFLSDKVLEDNLILLNVYIAGTQVMGTVFSFLVLRLKKRKYAYIT